jgi:hypothetical protein
MIEGQKARISLPPFGDDAGVKLKLGVSPEKW